MFGGILVDDVILEFAESACNFPNLLFELLEHFGLDNSSIFVRLSQFGEELFSFASL